MDIEKSNYLKKYRSRMTDVMIKTHPNWKKKDVEKVITKMIEKRFMNPDVVVDNNYTGDTKETTLLTVLDWTLDKKPLIAGNGTFYKNQHEAINPIARMLDMFAENRSNYKKKMFEASNKYGSEHELVAEYDRNQLNEKINMNSYYGGSGAKTSAFYSKWSGPATTLTAQSVISTAEQTFEGVLADNYLFINMTELMEWIRVVVKDDVCLDDFVTPIESQEKVVDRLLGSIINKEDNDREILNAYLNNLTVDDLTVLYYRNNMIEFIDNTKYVQELFVDILNAVNNYPYVDEKDEHWKDKIYLYEKSKEFDSPKKWNQFVNKEYFIDPNDPPKSIIGKLDHLSFILIKYCYTKYLSFDRIYRLRNFKRSVVTTIDTDSNFLSLDTIMEYLLKTVVGKNDYGRDMVFNTFILVNTLTFTITNIIETTLLFYGEKSNIPEEYHSRFNMKNEFFMDLLVIGEKKKRYLSNQVLREGNKLTPTKADIKGFDFKKATTSEYAEERFMKIIKENILFTDHIKVSNIIEELRKFRKEIKHSIQNGERKFLPNGNAKEFGAYADLGRVQSMRGAIAWNYLNPDNLIDFPSKVSLVKMNIFTEEDMEDLKDEHPDIYNIILDKIFHDESNIFVTKKKNPGIYPVNTRKKKWFEEIPEKFRPKFKKLGAKEWNKFVEDLDDHPEKYPNVTQQDKDGYYIYKKKGLQVLAIPSNGTIPEWALKYIDYDTMINNIIAPFKPVLDCFHAKFPEVGKMKNGVNRKTASLSNIIKF